MFRWCDDKQQRIDEVVCDRNLSTGACRRIKGGCKSVKVVNISDEERTRRSEAMKNKWKEKNGGDKNAELY